MNNKTLMVQEQPTRWTESVSTDYRQLMSHRIRKILLICSSYDAYILEEDGQLETSIIEEYNDLNLRNPPSFTRVATSAEALEKLRTEGDFDLILSLYNVGEPNIFEFSKQVKSMYPDMPVVLLANFSKEIYDRIEKEDRSALDYIFFWYGNADLIMAIIKLLEDSMNAESDILDGGVQCILLVEDSIRYYSTYLPVLYKLILNQSNEFLKEALNEQQILLRKRARPKILLASNYTEAVFLYQKYKENMLGVISDVGFVVNKNDPASMEKLDAGIDLCKLIKKDNPLMPFLLQSSQESVREQAARLNVGFLYKYSKTLLIELDEYITQECAFGDFIFKDINNEYVIGRARDLRDMQKLLLEIPDEVLLYHSSQNHLSKWLYSRGLFPLAAVFKAVGRSNFNSTYELRKYLSDKIKDYRIFLGQGVVAKFQEENYNESISFARIGNGSLGGKARGIAFFNTMMQKFKFYDKYENVRILIPRTVAITTEYFDRFIIDNGLQYVINSELTDEEILAEFVSSRLPGGLIKKLRVFLKYVKGPLAIRSSSKLEDSHYQPFAGVYSTYMIPRTADVDQMLRLLGKAIKSVYASVFFAASRAYITATSNVISDEKMGIVIQEICGTENNGFFFPTISGVARSINFYPLNGEQPSDGTANIALGLGKLVVEGGRSLRFSPKYPRNVLQLSTPQLARMDTQRVMYALDLRPEEFKTSIDDSVNIAQFEINSELVRSFRNMGYAASTWDRDNERVVDNPDAEGPKIITFARVLKYGQLPLAEIVGDLLDLGESEMRSPVEMEFAVNMDVPSGKPSIFNFLQIRPIVRSESQGAIDWKKITPAESVIYAEKALGTGPITDINHIVYIKTSSFDKSVTRIIAQQVGNINNTLSSDDLKYVLIGPGRWGTSDPWLGIPVKWSDISNSRVIVECGLPDYRIEPSQGTHFFQNLTSFGVGYITINPFMGDGYFDEALLDSMEAVCETEYVRVVKFPEDLFIYVDGRKSRAVIKVNDKVTPGNTD